MKIFCVRHCQWHNLLRFHSLCNPYQINVSWYKTCVCMRIMSNIFPSHSPVAVATVVSKLLEHFILSNISPFLGATDNQFGFKAEHGMGVGAEQFMGM